MDKTPTLETSRLLLRPLKLEDYVWAEKLFANYEIVKYLNASIPWPYPENGVHNFYKDVILPDVAAGKTIYWIIVEKSTQTPMGALDFRPQHATDNRGFWIGLPFHGKGYMSEAVAVMQDYAFDTFGMKKLLLTNAVPNTASGRIKEISGAVLVKEEEADFVSAKHIKQFWELTPENWRASPLKKKYDAAERLSA